MQRYEWWGRVSELKRGHNNKSKVDGRTGRKYADQQGERITECQEENEAKKKRWEERFAAFQ